MAVWHQRFFNHLSHRLYTRNGSNWLECRANGKWRNHDTLNELTNVSDFGPWRSWWYFGIGFIDDAKQSSRISHNRKIVLDSWNLLHQRTSDLWLTNRF